MGVGAGGGGFITIGAKVAESDGLRQALTVAMDWLQRLIGPAVMMAQNGDKLPAARDVGNSGGGNTSPGGLDPKDFKGIGERFLEKFKGISGADAVLKDLEMGGDRAKGASWQARYAMEHLNPGEVVGFEQAGTTGRIDVILRQGNRMTFLETKSINWEALERLGRTGEKAESIVRQILGHAEGQNVFSKVIIESAGGMPNWVVQLLDWTFDNYGGILHSDLREMLFILRRNGRLQQKNELELPSFFLSQPPA